MTALLLAGWVARFWLTAVLLVHLLFTCTQAAEPAAYYRPTHTESGLPESAAIQPSTQQIQSQSPGPLSQALGSWVAMGPAPAFSAQVVIPPNSPVCGAIQTVAAHPTNADILYIGAVNGGIWRTTNATAANPTWIPLTDTLPSLSIGALEFDPTDGTHQTLIAGSARLSTLAAEGGARIGVLRSTDGGNSWTILGRDSFANEDITSVAARGDVLLAASDPTWSLAAGSGGLFRSTNVGLSFTLISGSAGTGLPAGWVSDLVGVPGNTNRFYAAVGTNGIFRSDDAGAHWIDVTRGITAISDLTVKIEMAVHSSGAGNAVYVGIINTRDPKSAMNHSQLTAVYRSVNSGVSWTLMDVPPIHPGGQGDVHFAIAADPASPTIVYVGGDRIDASPFTGNLFRGDASRPRGSQFQAIMDENAGFTSPHADSREMVFDVSGNLIQADDGGIYRRSVPQSSLGTWSSVIGNLAVIEAHDVAYDSVARVAMIGTQDNGTQIQSAPDSLAWRLIQGGDGGDVTIDDTSVPGRSIRYGSSQFLRNFFRDTYDANNIRISHASPALSGLETNAPQFVTPLELNKVDPRRLVIGGADAIYESFDQGETVLKLAGGSGANHLSGIAYGGRLADLPNPEVLFYGSGSTVFCRTSAGTEVISTPAPFPGGIVRDVVLDSKNWQRVFVIDSSRVYLTPDVGMVWIEITGNLTGVGELRSVEFIQFPCSCVLAVGTDTGVYGCLDYDLGNWFKLGAGLPNAPAYDMSFNLRANLVVVGTLGRGAWSFAVPTNASRISTFASVSFPDTKVGEITETAFDVCSTCTEDLVVQGITNSNPQFRVVPPPGGFPVVIRPDACVSFAVEFVPDVEGDQSGTFEIASNDPLTPILRVHASGRGVKTRVAILGAEDDFIIADVKAKIVASGLFSASQVATLSVAEGKPIPTRGELLEYDAVLVFSNLRFNDPDALGNVLADYLDRKGGVVVATHSFSDDGISGLGGRIVSGGYLPLSAGSIQYSPHLTLVRDQAGHALLQNVSTFDGGLGSTRNGVTLTSGATLVAHWTGGTPLIATAESAGHRVVGLNFWPPSDDVDLYGWQSDTDGGTLMANALLWAGHQVHNPASQILVFSESPAGDFTNALVNLNLPFQFFGPEDSNAFADAVAAADPPHTLVIVEASSRTSALTNLVAFLNAGGRAILDYLALQAVPALQGASQVGSSGLFLGTFMVYDRNNSSVFDNLTSPLGFNRGAAGTRLSPLTNALAGFTSDLGDLGAAIVLGRSGRVLVNGFLLVDLASRNDAFVLAINELRLLTVGGGSPLPAIVSQPRDVVTTVGGTATFSVVASGSGPLYYSWLRNGVPIPGANAPTYTLTNVQVTDSSSRFSCVVSNRFGNTLSDEATLTVLVACGEVTVINFDDATAPATFPQTTHLTDRYQALGVTFEGPGELDGGAILNRFSNFGVSGYSGRNFLALNSEGVMRDGGVAHRPESIFFATNVSFVRLMAGSGLDPGHSVTLTAYDLNRHAVASASGILAGKMAPLQVTGDAIRSVVVSTLSPTLVLDDLTFVPACPPPQILPATLQHLADGRCSFRVSGSAGARYEIQGSSDLNNWVTLQTLILTDTTAECIDSNPDPVRRFYRARLVP